jgi:hypothetical protein
MRHLDLVLAYTERIISYSVPGCRELIALLGWLYKSQGLSDERPTNGSLGSSCLVAIPAAFGANLP